MKLKKGKMMKELIRKVKEAICTLPKRFVRELMGDENSIINTYRQMSPEYKSIFFAQATQLLDMQIEREKDNSDISDNYLYYYVSDVDGFFKACDFIKPYSFCELVIAVNRNLESICVYGFHFGDISDYAYIIDEMEMFIVREYIYENLKTHTDIEQQLKAHWFFEQVSFYDFNVSLMG